MDYAKYLPLNIKEGERGEDLFDSTGFLKLFDDKKGPNSFFSSLFENLNWKDFLENKYEPQSEYDYIRIKIFDDKIIQKKNKGKLFKKTPLINHRWAEKQEIMTLQIKLRTEEYNQIPH